ncbi:coat protein [Asparagus virus 3]|uniref:Coat protein n=1 Tax=Asparagus virus 3 TaxID=445435 RepID=Q8QXK5_9VIRU|nr:coat protein [Asparagus virus 3]CAC87090.1 coat protein [Asparagus virus 3]
MDKLDAGQPQRKQAEPVPADLSDPTRAPSLKELQAVKYVSTTTSVATPDEIKQLGELFQKLGVDGSSIGPAMWDLARAYADVQSSRSAMLAGTTPSNPAITRQALARQFYIVNITPRQFCMYFAKVVWNMMIDSNVPPAGWVKHGLPEDCKFAGFVFFEGVLSPSSLDPADGLIRHPSQREIQAHSTAKYGALARQRIQNGNFVSNLAEVTHGRAGGVNSMYAIEAPPEL